MGAHSHGSFSLDGPRGRNHESGTDDRRDQGLPCLRLLVGKGYHHASLGCQSVMARAEGAEYTILVSCPGSVIIPSEPAGIVYEFSVIPLVVPLRANGLAKRFINLGR